MSRVHGGRSCSGHGPPWGPEVLEYVAALRGRVTQALEPHVADGRPVVLLDAAAYSNVGDCAITMGTLQALHDLNAQVAHVADHRHFDEAPARAALAGDGVILLQGGGNLGDLWLRNQRFRERVVEAFPDHPIVQLPQSIHFRDPENGSRFARLIEAHGGVHLMVRDVPSLEWCQGATSAPAQLVPDMAFCLDDHPVRPGGTSVRHVRRRDREALGPEAPGSVDWPRDHMFARRSLGFALPWGVERLTRVGLVADVGVVRRVGRSTVRPLASARLRSGMGWLAESGLVVSDRLHVHILATLCSIPHVVLESATGKVTAFVESWPGLPGSFVAVSEGDRPEQIDAAIRRLRQSGDDGA